MCLGQHLGLAPSLALGLVLYRVAADDCPETSKLSLAANHLGRLVSPRSVRCSQAFDGWGFELKQQAGRATRDQRGGETPHFGRKL